MVSRRCHLLSSSDLHQNILSDIFSSILSGIYSGIVYVYMLVRYERTIDRISPSPFLYLHSVQPAAPCRMPRTTTNSELDNRRHGICLRHCSGGVTWPQGDASNERWVWRYAGHRQLKHRFSHVEWAHLHSVLWEFDHWTSEEESCNRLSGCFWKGTSVLRSLHFAPLQDLLGLTKAVGIAAECLAGWHRSNCRCSSARGLGTDQQSQRRLAWTFSPAPDGIYEGSDASSTQPPPLQPSGLRDLLCWHSFFDVPHAHVVMCRRLGTAECCQDWVWEDPFVGMDHKGVPGTQSCCGLAFWRWGRFLLSSPWVKL